MLKNIVKYLEDAEPIDLDSLSTRTKNNLSKLEDRGFIWNKAYRVPVDLYMSHKKFGTKTPIRKGYSFLVEGQGPGSEEVWLVRRESGHIQAGQSYLMTPFGNIQLTDIISPYGAGTVSRSSRSSKSAYSKYTGTPKKVRKPK